MKQTTAAAELMRPDSRYARAGRAARKPVDGDLQPHELDDKGGIVPADADEDHWGYHLIIDCSECDVKVDEPAVVTTWLQEMVKALDMTPVGDPLVHQFTGGKEGRGTSAVQIITTSSITFHSDDDGDQAYIDIFSCKSFKPETAIDLANKFFKPKKCGTLWLYRDAGPWPEK